MSEELSAYRAVNILHLSYKKSLLMLFTRKVAVCAEIHTQHIKAM
jgi:hypothetical protein